MRALSFSLSAVALTLLTAAPGPWDDPSREERPSRTDELVDRTAFLGPVASSEAMGGATQQVEGIPRVFYFSRASYTG